MTIGAEILDALHRDDIIFVVAHDDPFDDLALRLGGEIRMRSDVAGTLYTFTGQVQRSIYADADLLHRLAIAAGRAVDGDSTVCGGPTKAFVMIAPPTTEG